MTILTIIYYNLKRILLDKKVFFGKLVIPIVLTVVLGTALSSAFEPSDLEKSKIGYVNLDEGKAGDMIISKLVDNEEIKDIINFKEVTTVKQAEKQVKDEKMDGYIIIDKGFSKKIASEERNIPIQIKLNDESEYQKSVIQNVMSTFTNIVNTNFALQSIGAVPSESAQSESTVRSVSLSSNGKKPKAIDYYAVTMLGLIILMGCSLAAEFAGEDFNGAIGERIRISPIRPFQEYVGKMASAAIVTFLQGLILVAFTTIVYKVDWGDRLWLIALIIFIASIATTGIGLLATLVFKDQNRAGAVLNILVHVFTFLAGGYVAMDISLKIYSPNHYIQSALFNTIYDSNLSVIMPNLVALIGITAVTVGLSVVLGRRVFK